MIVFDPNDKLLTLSVGDLVHHGSLPAIRAMPGFNARLKAGTSEHHAWQTSELTRESRPHFRSEVSVTLVTEVRDITVKLEGRLDGLHFNGSAWVVEEIKTVLIPPSEYSPGSIRQAVLEGSAYTSYRFQAELYMLMVQHDIDRGRLGEDMPGSDIEAGESSGVHGRMILYNLLSSDPATRELIIDLDSSQDEVAARMHERLEAVLDEFITRDQRQRATSAITGDLPFAFESYRPQQEELERTTFNAFESGKNLLLSAPPGLGKTAAVLHAALTFALPRGLKVFWVTAKTTQQHIVVDTLELMLDRWAGRLPSEWKSGQPPLRALVLRAREKMCPNLEESGMVFCHEEYCRYARDYGRKIAEAHLLEDILELPIITPEIISERVIPYTVCPYELSLDTCLEADLIVGDYNYIFDPLSALRRFSLTSTAAQSILVIDEAHNLYSRGRQYYSPALTAGTVLAFRNQASDLAGVAPESLQFVAEKAIDLFADLEAVDTLAGPGGEAALVEIDREELQDLESDLGNVRLQLLFREGGGLASPDDPIDRLHRELRGFNAALELIDDGVPVVTVLDSNGNQQRLRALCLDPSEPLGARIKTFHSTIAMSATLEPLEFFRDVLGFREENTKLASFGSPFPRGNRSLHVVPDIETTYRQRQRHTARIAELVDAISATHRGNYLVFFPSYSYLKKVISRIDPLRVGRDILVQTPGMTEADRSSLLDRLREPGSARTLYGVHGGIFSEGVDYPGSMAIGVIIVGPGLPRYCYEEELVRNHFQDRYGKGFEYAYLYPGMHRVLQAAGRVIRSPEDLGIIVLLGRRFADSRYAHLFPGDWYEESPAELISDNVVEEVERFWKSHQ